MLFCNYISFCVYQFSFDRIDNRKIHSNNNLRIVCWNCNSSGYGSIKLSCSRECHENLDTSHERSFYRETSTHLKCRELTESNNKTIGINVDMNIQRTYLHLNITCTHSII